jgi:hypothetical protein
MSREFFKPDLFLLSLRGKTSRILKNRVDWRRFGVTSRRLLCDWVIWLWASFQGRRRGILKEWSGQGFDRPDRRLWNRGAGDWKRDWTYQEGRTAKDLENWQATSPAPNLKHVLENPPGESRSKIFLASRGEFELPITDRLKVPVNTFPKGCTPKCRTT